MSQFTILLIWVAKATALLLLAGGLTLALRRAPAGARYVVWLATLATLLVIPAISSWSPIPLRVLPPASASVVESSVAPTNTAAPDAAAATSRVAGSIPNTSSSLSQATRPTAQARASSFTAYSLAQILLAAWAIVVAGILTWLLLGALAVRRILRTSVALTDENWLHPMYDVADRLGLEHAPRVVISNLIEMPFACGVTHPTIVLPRSAEQWSEERRRVVLFHELAHIRRRDLLGHTLGRLTCALYWFHPLVWSAAKRLRAESERACDDLVLDCGGARPSEYANHLLDIVTSIRMQGAPATALPMADKKEFEGRMLAILDPAITRATPSRAQSAALLLGLGALSFTIAAVTPAVRADAAGVPAQVATQPHAFVPSDTALTAKADTSRARARSAESRYTNAVTQAVTNTVAHTTTDVVTQEVTRAMTHTSVSFGNGKDWKTQSGPVDTALIGRVLRTDKDAVVRKSAAWVLQGHPEGVPLLIERLKVDPDADVREMSAWALASDESPQVAAALAQALRTDKDEHVRTTAAWGLGQQGQADSSALIAALSDEDDDVRERALWAIGQHHFGVASRVAEMLKDDRDQVRVMAAWVLGEMQDRSTIPALRAAFPQERNKEAAQGEFRALLLMGDRSPELIDLAMKSPDPDLRAAGVRMMAGAGMKPWPWPWPWPEPRPEP
jgi:beta-lactamase regulating signal transducer with metallopeptidase domain/HEAT repeat protein